MKSEANRFFATQAWVQGDWASNVLLEVDATGHWSKVQAHAPEDQRQGAQVLSGAVLPGLVNAHSHAFQRAIAGLTERRSIEGGGATPRSAQVKEERPKGAGDTEQNAASPRHLGASDNFWTWRDRMYTAANRISPEQLEAIATQLYAELLQGGYTQVCEFQYLHNDLDGSPYADPAEMSLALVRAAQRTGIGLTLLPTLYMRSGFAANGLREDQRRFASTPDSIARIVESVQRQTKDDARIHVGIALHSLRAVPPAALNALATYAQTKSLPVHIHIADQTQEVADCLAPTGQRPIEWLLNHAAVDLRWNLVHATHTTAQELAGIAKAGASIVICPSTEANLGDGVFDLPGYAAVQGRWSIGSDSHMTRSWTEELRLLEYSQRLTLRQRNVAAQGLGHTSTAAALLQAALAGGSGAAGCALGGIAVGQRADFVVLDGASPALLGIPADDLLDAQVFSSPSSLPLEVWLAGHQRPSCSPSNARTFAWVMESLWSPDR
ncbi:MAG: formimidoylglutamate deiminase [Burkholderiales bacterium PBB4]|nr:MAG: formimidoylglutamate deiminase [Burkholderiales bacterium PBB4]